MQDSAVSFTKVWPGWGDATPLHCDRPPLAWERHQVIITSNPTGASDLAQEGKAIMESEGADMHISLREGVAVACGDSGNDVVRWPTSNTVCHSTTARPW